MLVLHRPIEPTAKADIPPQIGHMVSSVIGFVFAHRNASAELVDFGLEPVPPP
jgi:hypothetical protein